MASKSLSLSCHRCRLLRPLVLHLRLGNALVPLRLHVDVGRIITGLEDNVDPDEEILRCVLPLPGLCTARPWEYNGQRYFASGWVYAGGNREAGESGVDGYGVWKGDDKGGLVAVSAKTHKAMLDQVYAGQRSVGMIFPCSVHAEANLGIMFVYDLSTGDWGGT
ncbi:hypothetical protein SELMODRAFT_416948 [Selaginella moellendorffii]|uniref:Uncharacterized protein n=1 Tax=Selaginella moellendorffii TaxID=88036 RepID=D8S0W6_SELML|nr:hypothetical protein SELMODRAFT_416948 [Selaginella moellendorffii]